jgi:Yip1 domain
MNFDFKKTLDLVKGGLLKPAETWSSYLGENPGWQQTLVVLTAPLILANIVLSLLLSRMMGTMSPFGLAGNWFMALVLGLVMACVAFAVAVFVFNFLAGVFGGKPDFSRAFAAMSLAAIPAWIAGIIGAAVPWVGGLISLAGAIVTLVFLYKILPLALGVPDEKRVLHFVVSLVAIVVVNIIVATVLGIGRMGSGASGYDLGDRGTGRDAGSMPGVFGEVGRQAELMAEAGEDRYEPPADGMVSREQARWVAGVVDKSRLAYEEEMARLNKLSEEVDDKEKPSPGDMVKIYQGMGSVLSLNTIEMEVVKSGGGNWAEYLWVKEQLRNAQLQRGEGSDTLAHNYELYQELEDSLQGQL